MHLRELKKWFAKQELPKEMRINQCTYCTDVKKCVESCIATLEANPKNKGYLPYYDQLMEIKKIIEGVP